LREHGAAIAERLRTKEPPRALSPRAWMAMFDLSAPLLVASAVALVAGARRHPALAVFTFAAPPLFLGSVSLAFHSERFYDPLDVLPIAWLTLGAGLVGQQLGP